MKPIAPLMIEHRLIERMIHLLSQEITHIDERAELRPDFIDGAVDFLRTYADRTHHGKEEDILFRDLGKKDLKEEDEKAMKQLVEEHKQGRRLVRSVAKATEQYRSGGDSHLVSTIRDNLQAIAEFYPTHIEKEDVTIQRKNCKVGKRMLDRVFLTKVKTQCYVSDMYISAPGTSARTA